jgi:predicted aspartyl protease
LRVAVVLVALVSSALCSSAADRPQPGVPLSIDAQGGIAVEVRVNDSGPYRFLLDTGASRSIVSETLARELGAPVVAKTEVVTIAGADVRPVVRLASLSLAASRVEGVLAPVLPDARLPQLGRRLRGVLGQDFLSAFNYTLDYRRSRLTWDELLTCDAPGAVRMAAVDGRFVMTLVDDRGAARRLVPDSGADVPILFSAASPREDRLTIPGLRVGAVRMPDVAAYVVQRADAHADGLLPLHQFSAVSFAEGGACLLARE